MNYCPLNLHFVEKKISKICIMNASITPIYATIAPFLKFLTRKPKCLSIKRRIWKYDHGN